MSFNDFWKGVKKFFTRIDDDDKPDTSVPKVEGNTDTVSSGLDTQTSSGGFVSSDSSAALGEDKKKISPAAAAPAAAALGMDNSAIATVGTLGNLGLGVYDRYKQNEYNKQSQQNFEDSYELSQAQFEYEKWLAEHSHQVAVADAQAAGLSPLAALGLPSFSGTSAPSSPGFNTSVGHGDLLSSFVGLSAQQNQKDIAKMQVEAQKDVARMNNESAESIAAMQAENTANIADLNRIAETDRFLKKLASESDIAKAQLEELQRFHNQQIAEQKAKRKDDFNARQAEIDLANEQLAEAKRKFDTEMAESKDYHEKQLAQQRYNTKMSFWSSILNSVVQGASRVGSAVLGKKK